MAALPLKLNSLRQAEMEYHGKFGHNLGRVQHISLMSRIDICYTTCNIKTQTVAPTLTGFQVINHCVKCMANRPHKTISYPYNYYDGSNVIILTWSGNQVEDYMTHNFFRMPSRCGS